MKSILLNLKLPVVVSFILVIPLVILELINQPASVHDFPFSLFIVLWVLPILFTLILIPIVRNVREGTSLATKPLSFIFNILLLLVITFMWFGILTDQMPCFMGVPNCD